MLQLGGRTPGDAIPPDVRALVLHALPLALAAALVTWLSSGALVRWDGHVSHRLPAQPDDAVVGIVLDEGQGSRVLWWPRWVAMSLDVPTERSTSPPPRSAADRPAAHKDRWALSFTVRESASAQEVRVPTTSPRTAGLGVLAFAFGLALRNMWWSGAPWRIAARAAVLPAAMARSGVPVRPEGPQDGRKAPPPRPGPPPRHRSRGR
jgi:hypothetical protein